jgi:hypothetical protein
MRTIFPEENITFPDICTEFNTAFRPTCGRRQRGGQTADADFRQLLGRQDGHRTACAENGRCLPSRRNRRELLTPTFMSKQIKLVPFAAIETRIHSIRGKRVRLDTDLAELYGVATKNLNKAVERNRDRFPEDFMCQLTAPEFADLRFQIGTSSRHGGRRHLP